MTFLSPFWKAEEQRISTHPGLLLRVLLPGLLLCLPPPYRLVPLLLLILCRRPLSRHLGSLGPAIVLHLLDLGLAPIALQLSTVLCVWGGDGAVHVVRGARGGHRPS